MYTKNNNTVNIKQYESHESNENKKPRNGNTFGDLQKMIQVSR